MHVVAGIVYPPHLSGGSPAQVKDRRTMTTRAWHQVGRHVGLASLLLIAWPRSGSCTESNVVPKTLVQDYLDAAEVYDPFIEKITGPQMSRKGTASYPLVLSAVYDEWVAAGHERDHFKDYTIDILDAMSNIKSLLSKTAL
jgi:hypothetical protein